MGNLAHILRGKELHPDIAIHVIDRFDQGFLDDAILNAFKVIEEKLRAITGSYHSDAMELIKQAFHPNTGFLTDPRLWPSEKEGLHQLFRGAFLTYRNSSAHRYTFITPDEACDAIIIANRLYLIVEKCYKNKTAFLNIHTPTPALAYPKIDSKGGRTFLDVDNDGQDEIIATKFGYNGMQLEIYRVDSDHSSTIEIGGESLDIIMADIDNDGLKEIACLIGQTAGSTLTFYRHTEQGFVRLSSFNSQKEKFEVAEFFDAQVADFDGDSKLEVISEPWDKVPDDLLPKGMARESHDWGRVRFVYRWNSLRSSFELIHRELLYIGGR